MRNAALPRDLTTSTMRLVPQPLPMRSFWRSRRRVAVPPPAPAALPAATLRRDHAPRGVLPDHPTDNHPVLVHDYSLSAVDLRSRLPLDVCGHYCLHSDHHGSMLRGSRVRVVSCRREPGGLYAIGAEICR
jgi:hypothetical protein